MRWPVKPIGKRPSTGAIETLRPSAPPVIAELRLASSPSISATPIVTISRVRSEPRSSSGAVASPSARGERAGDRRARAVGIGETLAREDRRGVGAEAEEGRVTERDDAGQAEDEIERKREQAGDQNLVEESRARGKARIAARIASQNTISRQRHRSRRRKCAASRARCGDAASGAHRPSPLANSPCGRRISVTTMTK